MFILLVFVAAAADRDDLGECCGWGSMIFIAGYTARHLKAPNPICHDTPRIVSRYRRDTIVVQQEVVDYLIRLTEAEIHDPSSHGTPITI